MLGLVKEINGQKTIIPLTTDTGTGAAVGSLLQQYKKKPISGYLYCDGSTFDQNVYPALYMYLGSNVLPDYRECVMVGAEQNTTDTIATHDVYTEGEFKDDQLQEHYHNISRTDNGAQNLLFYQNNGSGADWHGALTTTVTGQDATIITTTETHTGRGGDTTHGKQKAVYVYIKATSGLAENQQDNVLRDVKDYVDNSISRLHPTIDVSKVFSNGELNVYILYNTYGAGRYIMVGQGSVGHSTSTIDIWTLASGSVECVMSTSYSNSTSGVTKIPVNSSSQTIATNKEYLDYVNYITKVCSLL